MLLLKEIYIPVRYFVHITIGDFVEIYVLSVGGGVEKEIISLRKD